MIIESNFKLLKVPKTQALPTEINYIQFVVHCLSIEANNRNKHPSTTTNSKT